MGRSPAAPPGPFSKAISAYARHLTLLEGGDNSGRWLAARLPREPQYYMHRMAGTKAFDTNDVADLAELFEATPQGFVRAAVAYAAALAEQEAAIEATRTKTITEADEWTLAAQSDAIDAEEGYEEP